MRYPYSLYRTNREEYLITYKDENHSYTFDPLINCSQATIRSIANQYSKREIVVTIITLLNIAFARGKCDPVQECPYCGTDIEEVVRNDTRRD